MLFLLGSIQGWEDRTAGTLASRKTACRPLRKRRRRGLFRDPQERKAW
jgi:hypothetical protein